MAHTTYAIVIDTEATTFEKGNPFSQRNKLMCVGCYAPHWSDKYRFYDIEHSGLPYVKYLYNLKALLEKNSWGKIDLLIGFNIKYDLHWLRRYIPDLRMDFRVWDCQLAQFILNDQTTPYPSLDECLSQHQLPLKSDIVK